MGSGFGWAAGRRGVVDAVAGNNSTLVMLSPMLPDPTPDMTKLVPVSEHTFRMESPMGYGSPGELLVFELDEKGKVKRVKTGATYIHPVENW